MATRSQIHDQNARVARLRAAQVAAHPGFPDEGGDGKYVAIHSSVGVVFDPGDKKDGTGAVTRYFAQGEHLKPYEGHEVPESEIERLLDLGGIAEAADRSAIEAYEDDDEPLAHETAAQKKKRLAAEAKAAKAAAEARNGDGPEIPGDTQEPELAGF